VDKFPLRFSLSFPSRFFYIPLMWIALSLAASLFFALRYILIKKYLTNCDSLLISFATRVFSLLFLLPLLAVFPLHNWTTPLFWGVIACTAMFTGIATVVQVHAIKRYDLSSSLPFLAFVPLFMIGSVYLVFGEAPDLRSCAGVLLLSLGAFVVHFDRKQGLPSLWAARGAGLFLLVAVIYGFTTTFDRLAISTNASGGFTYTFFWHVASVALFALIFIDHRKAPAYRDQIIHQWPVFAMQGLLAVLAFLCQMWAVETARGVAANVIYVKALTMLEILLGAIAGIWLFREKNAASRIAGTLLMLIGAAIVVLMNA
jgi:drug/metabolite transporter (DMT)-like permease